MTALRVQVPQVIAKGKVEWKNYLKEEKKKMNPGDDRYQDLKPEPFDKFTEAMLTSEDRDGMTCIHWTAGKERKEGGAMGGANGAKFVADELVLYLLEVGANAEAYDKAMATPLHYAASSGRRTAMKHLVEYLRKNDKAAITKVTKQGQNALHWAALAGQANVCDDMVSFVKDYPTGDPAIDKIIESIDSTGASPLLCACKSGGDPDTILRLIKHKGMLGCK